ncbi:MAG: hypothetical protein AAF514_14420 [Verrucomicrobiota bacterium]
MVCLTAFASAGLIPNGDFSSGFSNWSTTGDTDTDTSFTYGGTGGGTISPTTGSHVSEIQSSRRRINSIANFLGVSTADLRNAGGIYHNGYDGAAIQTTFFGSGEVSFDWNFWTTDAPSPPIPIFNDFAVVTLSGPGIVGTQITLLADVYDNGLATASGLGPVNGTGWQSLTLNLPSTGNYTIGFASLNENDRFYDTYLHIDNVQVHPLPEPGTFLGASFLLGFLLLHRSRRRHR